MDNPITFIFTVFVLIILAVFFVFNVIHSRSTNGNDLGVTLTETVIKNPTGTKKPSSQLPPTNTGNQTSDPAYEPPTTSITPQVTPDYVISYTLNGFSPQTLRITSGKVVRFVNQTKLSMRITSATSPTAGGSPEFSQSTTVGYAGHFDVTTGRKGTFVYYNINDTKKYGVIIVE